MYLCVNEISNLSVLLKDNPLPTPPHPPYNLCMSVCMWAGVQKLQVVRGEQIGSGEGAERETNVEARTTNL